MDRSTRTTLQVLAAQLVVASAAVHLWLGLPRSYLYLRAGTPLTDPRQPLFVLSALCVLVGFGLLVSGADRARVYALGVVLMAGNVVAWLLAGGHPGVAWESVGHGHGGPLVTLVDHFLQPYVFVSKTAEIGAIAALSALYHDARRRGDADRETPATDAPAVDERDAPAAERTEG
jgi:hypothetical protein